ncbi:hypothetical protein CYLTODRAFT_488032, partial [Cylindrobasidium torrendii FP15055 ss-10]
MLGLGRGELDNNTKCVENTFEVQPLMYWYLQRRLIDFVPSISISEKVLQLASHNMTSSPNERILFSSIAGLDPSCCVYTLTIDQFFGKNRTLYTRHPITGHVRAHTAPYTELPCFVLSASPCMVALALSPGPKKDWENHPVWHIGKVLHATRPRPPNWFEAVPAQPNNTIASSNQKSGFSAASSCPSETQATLAPSSPKRKHNKKRPHGAGHALDEPSSSSNDLARPQKRHRRAKNTTDLTGAPQGATDGVIAVS